MNIDEIMQNYFKNAEAEEAFIPLEKVESFLIQKTTILPASTRLHKQRATSILIPAGLAVALLVFLFSAGSSIYQNIGRSVRTTQHQALSTQRQQTTGKPSAHQTPKASGSEDIRSNTVRSHDRMSTAFSSSGDHRKNSAAVVSASWSPIAIPPMRIYILDSLELANIGAFVTDDGFLRCWAGRTILEHDAVNGHTDTTIFHRDDFGRISDETIRHRLCGLFERPLRITYSFVSDERGRGGAYPDFSKQSSPKLSQPKESFQSVKHIDLCIDNLDPKFQRLIPILIRTLHETKIFWMDPTPDLLMRLPDWLLSDIHGRDETDRNKKTSSPKIIRGNDLRFTLRSGDTPEKNPAVELELNSRRNLAMALYDIQGNLVKELAPLQSLEKGVCEQEVDVSDVSSGVYLFAILSNSGEHSVQRICVP